MLTKSGLIVRDKDLMKRFASIEAGLTITGLSGHDGRLLEPRASPHSERISALEELRKEGIRTWAFVGPILPGLSDPEMIFRELSGLVDHVLVDRLNLRSVSWGRLEPLLRERYPKLLPLYSGLSRGDTSIWNDIMPRIHTFARKYGVRVSVV
jgi:DNA repair photolyase